ncbi:hypothetical protein HDU91_002234, partial [Kappamyces sp. JEL0680]
KEGLCGICKPDRWLQLKDSAFWYHKQFYHGISSTSGTYFLSPLEFRTVWSGTPSDSGYTIYLMTEGKCHQCSEWVALFKNKKRFSSHYATFEAIQSDLISTQEALATPPALITADPLKIAVGRTAQNQVYIPPCITVSKSLLADIKSHEAGTMSGVWFRHAHSCHQYTPTSPS